MIGVSEDIDLNEVYDKYGNGSKTYEEFLINANIRPDTIKGHIIFTIKDYFDKCNLNFLILLPETNRFSNRRYPRLVYEINVFRGTNSFERLIGYINNYFDFFISTGDTNSSLIIATRNGMAILNLNSVIDDFKTLELDEDDLNLLRRTLFEIKLM